MDEKRLRCMVLFGLLMAEMYLTFGLLQVVFGITGRGILLIPGDIVGGAILALIGSVFLAGVAVWLGPRGEDAGAYVHVGAWLGVIFCLVRFVFLAANALAFGLGMEDFGEWRITDDMVPMLYLALFPLAAMLRWRTKSRKEMRGNDKEDEKVNRGQDDTGVSTREESK
ncbi:MAG: hypothetical protein CVT48_06070 [Thermoplasmata archaeon HGW-Thermoplasmata-1]|nr:MAG: hypothetical protein CVT48_06070 [Thermoplasmata archaeon HGW-Thermoplasmata-1]